MSYTRQGGAWDGEEIGGPWVRTKAWMKKWHLKFSWRAAQKFPSIMNQKVSALGFYSEHNPLENFFSMISNHFFANVISMDCLYSLRD